MAEQETPTLRKVAWTELLPWLILVRCFRISIQVRLLLAGAVGVALTLAGWMILGWLFSANDRVAQRAEPQLKLEIAGRGVAVPVSSGTKASAEGEPAAKVATAYVDVTPFWMRAWAAEPLHKAWDYLSKPWLLIFSAGDGAKSFTDRLTWFVFALACGLLSLAVWAFFGGIIARAAAVELATLDRAKTGRTVRFACNKWRSYLAAPFFPFLGVLLIGFPVAVLGLFLRTEPTIWLAALAWPLVLVAGFGMALLLLGLMFGWPLMFANISVEGVDSFDAVGRAYNYVFQRPLQYLFYAVVTGVLGALGWFLLNGVLSAVGSLSYGAAAWGGGDSVQAVAKGSEGLGVIGASGAWLIHFWVDCLYYLAAGFIFSYFFTASTAIYLLLRRDADATEMDQVCPEEEEQPSETVLPAAPGVPAATLATEKLPSNQAE